MSIQKGIDLFGWGVCLMTPPFVADRFFYPGATCDENNKGFALLGVYVLVALAIIRSCCRCAFSGGKSAPRSYVALDTANQGATSLTQAFINKNIGKK